MAELLYPPLTALADMPLHGGRLSVDEPREHFACMADYLWEDRIAFDWRCPDCVQRAVGFAECGHADDEMLWVPRNGLPAQRVTLAWNIDRAHYWGVR